MIYKHFSSFISVDVFRFLLDFQFRFVNLDVQLWN